MKWKKDDYLQLRDEYWLFFQISGVKGLAVNSNGEKVVSVADKNAMNKRGGGVDHSTIEFPFSHQKVVDWESRLNILYCLRRFTRPLRDIHKSFYLSMKNKTWTATLIEPYRDQDSVNEEFRVDSQE